MSILVTIGGILTLVGWLWAIINGFQTSGALWGIINIIPIQPIIGVVSAAMKKISWNPVFVMLAGVVLSLVARAIS